jgi:magnesium-transporting ATPase (P-type)
MRAVQSSDYAIGEFKILHRLLLFHGRIFYIRNSQCILYFFYKNFYFTLVQFIYGFYTNFSGQTIIDDWYISFYNLIFTALPLGARALLDIDLRPEDGQIVKKLFPFLYAELKIHPIFNKKIFSLYLLKGTVHCIINFFFTIYSTVRTAIDKDGNNDCLWFTSVNLYTNILLLVSLDLDIETVYITWINVFVQVVTTFIFYIIFLIAVHYFSFFNSYASINNSVKSPILWMNIIFVSILGYFFDFLTLIYKYNFSSNISKELKLIYNEYGPINSTEHLSEKIKNILKKCDENKDKEDNYNLNDEMKIIPINI